MSTPDERRTRAVATLQAKMDEQARMFWAFKSELSTLENDPRFKEAVAQQIAAHVLLPVDLAAKFLELKHTLEDLTTKAQRYRNWLNRLQLGEDVSSILQEALARE